MGRMGSLKKDNGDITQFRHHRTKDFGACVSWEYMQPMPMFFTRESATLNLVGHYRGASAFMICNGPSLASGRYDLSLLHKPGIITYGINNGPKTIRPTFWSCVDDPKRFIKSIWVDPNITKFVPHAHSEKPLFDSNTWQIAIGKKIDGSMGQLLVGDCPNVVYYHRNSKFHAERFLTEDTINWGNAAEFNKEAPGRTVMLPVFRILYLLGFRNIYLLGADFKMSETYTYHFDEQRHKGAVQGNLSTYNTMQNIFFPQLKPYFDAAGFNVWNCTEDSGLTVFPFKKYEDAIAECMAPLGDYENERTWGLYTKPEERAKWTEEPPPECKPHLHPSAPHTNALAPAVAKAPTPQQYAEPHFMPVRNVPSTPMTPQNEQVIRSRPCGAVSTGSSRQERPQNKSITLPDNGL